MPKNILVFSDGTGQVGGEGPDTNVYKLFKSVENRTKRQIAFYDRGIGTGIYRITGNTGGLGISRNILQCYQFIFENYEADDQIFLFGFSRGAATVRSLSSFIEAFGILPKSRPGLIKEAYKIYKTRDKGKRQKMADDFNTRHHTMWTKIKFLGVWDTVAALGLPIPILDRLIDKVSFLKHKFHNFQVSAGVSNAYHALSIDEKRKTFLPTLFDEKKLPDQTLEQVWFAGVHTDIGGGYPETGLSDITLKWMIDKAVQHKLLLFNKDILKHEGNPLGPLHISTDGVFKYLTKVDRFWPEYDGQNIKRGEPVIDPSVYERAKDKDNTLKEPYKPWILSGD